MIALTSRDVSLLAYAAEEFVYRAFFANDGSPTIFDCTEDAWLAHEKSDHFRSISAQLSPDGCRTFHTMFRVARHLLHFGENGCSRATSYDIAERIRSKPHAQPVAVALQCLAWALSNSLARRSDTPAAATSCQA